MEKGESGKGRAAAMAAPTGCYKCGRPGHWSRDCPSSSGNRNPSADTSATPSSSSRFPQRPSAGKPPAAATSIAKKPPKTRPKLTPELLLSEDGLGYVLRHFPCAFKYSGRGHEVSDLGNLIDLYAQWHSHLIPCYSFDKFIRRVEQVGVNSRVRRCISDLKQKIANGRGPSNLHDSPVEVAEEAAPEIEQDDPMQGEPVTDAVDPSFEFHEAENIQDEVFDEIYRNATEESNSGSEVQAAQLVSQHGADTRELTSQNPESASDVSVPSKVVISEEQRARIEANRLRALERIAARSRSLAA